MSHCLQINLSSLCVIEPHHLFLSAKKLQLKCCFKKHPAVQFSIEPFVSKYPTAALLKWCSIQTES